MDVGWCDPEGQREASPADDQVQLVTEELSFRGSALSRFWVIPPDRHGQVGHVDGQHPEIPLPRGPAAQLAP